MSQPIEESAAANNSAPVANTAAVVTYAGVANKRHKLYKADWSYADPADSTVNPTAGSIKVENGGVVVWGPHHITRAGPGYHNFDPPLLCGNGSELKITLAAGGANVEGVLTCAKFTVKGDDDSLGLW